MRKKLFSALFLSLCSSLFLPFGASAHIITVTPVTPLPSFDTITSIIDATYLVTNNSAHTPLIVVDQSASHGGLPNGMSILPSSTCNGQNTLSPGQTCTLQLQYTASNKTGLTASTTLYEWAKPTVDATTYIIAPIDVISWTWISGSSTIDQAGNYGTQGVPQTTNIPGARFGSSQWTDQNNHLWLFGGGIFLRRCSRRTQ